MKQFITSIIFFTFLITGLNAEIRVGVGTAEITPPIGTPSAGYKARKGEGMEGVHDPLFAKAIFIDNGQRSVVFCSVDNLGFTYKIVQNIIEKVKKDKRFENTEIYIGSTHTHSGGGAFLDIPIVGELLAGKYNPEITAYYEDQTVNAILKSADNKVYAKIGFGYGDNKEKLSVFRSQWPKDVTPLNEVAIIKITREDDTPYAVLFNFPVHPTVLPAENRLFSADFIYYARNEIKTLLGPDVEAFYFNGAQGDVNPFMLSEQDTFGSCEYLGNSLAKTVAEIWKNTETKNELKIASKKHSYSFTPKATPQGLKLPVDTYQSELNLLVFNQEYAFLTIPGELSCVYDKRLKDFAKKFKYKNLSILGLTNDAHGYIITPEAWQNKTFESNTSFGGEYYGDLIYSRSEDLLMGLSKE